MRTNPRLLTAGVIAAIALVPGTSALIQVVPSDASSFADDAGQQPVNAYVHSDDANTPGFRLVTGDSNIPLVRCDDGSTSIEIHSYASAEPYCFHVKGTKGFVSLKLEQAYGIRNHTDAPIDVTVRVGDVLSPMEIPKDAYAELDTELGDGQAVILELRV